MNSLQLLSKEDVVIKIFIGKWFPTLLSVSLRAIDVEDKQ